ncbi:MAG: hypothetical protein AABY22_15805 [Nanoarchaeota archaeon]
MKKQNKIVTNIKETRTKRPKYMGYTVDETMLEKKEVEEALDELETFFIAELSAVLDGDIPMKRKDSMVQPKNITIHFDIARKQMGLKPKHHPRIVKNVEKMVEVFDKASKH